MFDFLTQNRELKEQNRTLKVDLEWNKFLRKEADGLNSSLKKILVKKNNKIAELEKRVADLEEQLAKKVFLLDDNCTPIKSFTLTGKLTMIKKPAEEKLEVGKWYDARTFDEATLKKLLPAGTLVKIVSDSEVDEKREEPNGDISIFVNSTVTSIESEVAGWDREETVIYVERYQYVSNNWFRILKEY